MKWTRYPVETAVINTTQAALDATEEFKQEAAEEAEKDWLGIPPPSLLPPVQKPDAHLVKARTV